MSLKSTAESVKRIFSLAMCFVLCTVRIICMSPEQVHAAQSTLTVEQVVSLAWFNSRDYRKNQSKIALSKVKYTQAVKSIRLKKKNMSTFRWSPVLNFKFPEKAALADEFEWVYKPVQIQGEISSLEHKLTDIKYAVKETVSNLYVDCYTAQEKIDFYKQLLEEQRRVLQANTAKLYVGEAKQGDIDSMQKVLDSTQQKLLAVQRSFESCKEKLTYELDMDVRTGYSFSNPYQEAEISRQQLNDIIQYTLDNSQAFYEAKVNTRLALMALDTNYNLMSSQYGGKMSIISGFVTQAKNGSKLDTASFKLAYDSFLNAIDSPWQGSRRILFIKIPKEWFKGSIDGIRYVEDDPYILYTNALEYSDALTEQNSTEKEITQEVKEQFNNLVTVRNSYVSIADSVRKQEEIVNSCFIQNNLGQMEYSEYSEAQELYNELQLEELDALALYTKTLNSFDRLTCGAISRLLEGKSISVNAVAAGESYYIKQMTDGARYDIVSKIEDNLFELTISIPDDFDVEVTGYELWINDIQVGNRTDADKTLRHLMLDMDNADKVIIRLYNGDKFVCDCEIDPMEYSGELPVSSGYVDENKKDDGTAVTTERSVGNFSYNVDRQTRLAEIRITPNMNEKISYFRITDKNGKILGDSEMLPVSKSFTYFSFILDDMDNLEVLLFDTDKQQLYTGHFNTKEMKVVVEG